MDDIVHDLMILKGIVAGMLMIGVGTGIDTGKETTGIVGECMLLIKLYTIGYSHHSIK